MRPWTLVIVVALLAAPLTGCLSGDDASGETVQKQRADVTAQTGGVEGVVTDNAVQPIEGANVTLQELDKTVQAASDGSYAFSNVKPGTYTLSVRAPGFISSQETVSVSAGEVAILDVLLTRATSEEPFSQRIELNGFIECGAGYTVEPLQGQVPLTTLSVAVCAVPQIAAGNSTNDKFLHNFDLEAPVEEVVYEMTWDSEATALLSTLEIRDFPNDAEATIWEGGGTPPLYAHIERSAFDRVAQNFTEICEGQNDTEQDDAYCGYNFRDRGWPLWTRVFAHWDCNELPARACPVLQEEFTHFISAFYHQQAPEGYAIIDGNGQP